MGGGTTLSRSHGCQGWLGWGSVYKSLQQNKL